MTDPGTDYPILLFGRAESADREKLTPGRPGGPSRRPTRLEQAQRFDARFQGLEEALERESLLVQEELAGIEPELVLVLETVGEVANFYRAAEEAGLDFLIDVPDQPLDDDGPYGDAEESGTYYVLSTAQAALSELLSLWELYKSGATKFPRGLTPIRNMFDSLNEIRRWSYKDRVSGTGFERDVLERLAHNQSVIPLEIDLWFRNNEARRMNAESRVRALVLDAGGRVVSRSELVDIRYHAMLVELPSDRIGQLLVDPDQAIELVRADDVAFFRPQAQAVHPVGDETEVALSKTARTEVEPDGAPVLAILDGVPLLTHDVLDRRVFFDDPDNLEDSYGPGQRQHGTAIASLALNGDLGDPKQASLRTPVYLRPVLTPIVSFDGSVVEAFPQDRLAVDLVHSALIRLLGSPATGPLYSSIRVINLSLGNASQQLAGAMSPWARLLDWASVQYGVLFIVSAGNHPLPLVFPVSVPAIRSMPDAAMVNMTLNYLLDEAHLRRILSPSEAFNALTVGASHADSSGSSSPANVDVLPGGSLADPLPSPISAIGLGHRRAIKPDLLAPGGRQVYRPMVTGSTTETALRTVRTSGIGPGLLVASPGAPGSGSLSATSFFTGTSGACAVVSNAAARLVEQLSDFEDLDGNTIDSNFHALLTRALLVHQASGPRGSSPVVELLRNRFGAHYLRGAVARLFGYGHVDLSATLGADAPSSATVISWGSVAPEQGRVYELPIPQALSGVASRRVLTVTLSYFPETVATDRRHKVAELFLTTPADSLNLRRVRNDYNLIRKGTLVQERWVGSGAVAPLPGSSVRIKVNARALVKRFTSEVPFALVVSLSAESENPLPIHSQIAAEIRLRERARVQARI